MMTRGGGVSIPPKSDDVISEQPLIKKHLVIFSEIWSAIREEDVVKRRKNIAELVNIKTINICMSYA